MRCVERTRTDAVGNLEVCLIITICVNFNIHYKDGGESVISCIRDPVYVQPLDICSGKWKWHEFSPEHSARFQWSENCLIYQCVNKIQW